MALLEDNMFENLFVEKYRPQSLKEIVLNSDTRKYVEEFNRHKELTNHLLLIGSPGLGKTSLAKIIVNDVLKCDYMYINASDENGIDTIRTRVIGFAQTKSFDGQLKVIILDEFDNFSGEGQRALRNVMEEYAANTRFIITANYKHKIIPAIQSRCVALSFDVSLAEVVKHCYGVAKRENIIIDDCNKAAFVEMVKKNYPDFRRIINEIQRCSTSGRFEQMDTSVDAKFIESVYEIALKDVYEARKMVIQNESSFQSDYHNLMKQMLNLVYKLPSSSIKQQHMLIITEHMYRHGFVADVEINFFACLININKSQ